MARDSSGNYSLPSGNPVTTNTTISSTVHNGTMSDVAAEITNSLDRRGYGSMSGQLKLGTGNASAPSIAWNVETTSGLYRNALNDIRIAVNTSEAQRWSPTGTTLPLGATVTQSQANTTALAVTGNGTATALAVTGGSGAASAASFSGTGTNQRGATFTGAGSDPGVHATGGLTGAGVNGVGGATNGSGVTGTGGAGGGFGVRGTGTTTFPGVSGVGGATDGTGVLGTGGATNGIGVTGIGTGTGVGGSFTGGGTGAGGDGLAAVGGAAGRSGVLGTGGSTGAGLWGVGGATSGIGVVGKGTGSGAGVDGTGGATSGAYGGRFTGGSTNGIGLYASGVGNGQGGQFYNASAASPNAALEAHSISSAAAAGYFNNSSTGHAIHVNQGNVKFTGTNPAATDAFLNVLTPLNVIKAAGRITTNGAGAATIAEGFNIASVAISASFILQVTFAQAMADAAYIVTSSVSTEGSPDSPLFSICSSRSTTVVSFVAIKGPGGVITNLNFDNDEVGINFIVIGRQ